MLALQNQLYNSENTNPNQLAIGSFDLAFVFVFLLPLLIIGNEHFGGRDFLAMAVILAGVVVLTLARTRAK